MASRRTQESGSSVDHRGRWRPRSRRGPTCGYRFDDKVCDQRGPHYCEPRADRPVAFFRELLVHTKGRWARTRFELEDWQEHEIIRPVFGEVVWSTEWGAYVRRIRDLYVVLARKNGKSEIAAGIVLFLLVGDDEQAAEVYGAAKDTKQAGKVADVVIQMRRLSRLLSQRLGYNKNDRRMFDERTGSYYEVITSDALGELGHNPHGFVLDEVLAQLDATLEDAVRTAAGTREQPLFVYLTTETNQAGPSYGARTIDEAERIAMDPRRAPHAHAFVRKTPRTDDELEALRRRHPGHPDLPISTDPWDERNWRWANPALGSFLSIDAMRKDALDARNDPRKTAAFRQFRLNQRADAATGHMPTNLWAACGRKLLTHHGRYQRGRAYGGLDLASAIDLASVCWLCPRDGNDDRPHRLYWRFWTTEAVVPLLDRQTSGRFAEWITAGLVRVTEGDWIDFDVIRSDLEHDLDRLDVIRLGYDPAMAPDTAQWLQKRGVDVDPVKQGYALAPAMHETMRLAKSRGIEHAGHPVAAWNAECVQARQKAEDADIIRPVKPDRRESGARIDGYLALLMAVHVMLEDVSGMREAITAAAAGAEDRGIYAPGRLDV